MASPACPAPMTSASRASPGAGAGPAVSGCARFAWVDIAAAPSGRGPGWWRVGGGPVWRRYEPASCARAGETAGLGAAAPDANALLLRRGSGHDEGETWPSAPE